MISLKELYYGIARSVNGICDKTYYKNRPKSVDERLNSYMVITLPSGIYNKEMDYKGSYNYYTTSVHLYIYVRQSASSRNMNAPDIKGIDGKVSDVMKVFPIDDDHIHVSHPEIVIQADDGSGFDVVCIHADLTTK